MLSWTDLVSCGAVCISWKKFALELLKANFYPNAFRPKDWTNVWACRTLDQVWDLDDKRMKGGYKGLPKNIFEILNLTCPFEAEKKIKDIYILAFIPYGIAYKGARVVRQPPPVTQNAALCLARFSNMTGTHIEHHKTKNPRMRTLGQEQNSPMVGENSHWVLMRRRPINDEFRIDLVFFKEQESVLKANGFTLPSPLQAAVCISALVFNGLDHSFVGSDKRNSVICKTNKRDEALKITTVGPCILENDITGPIYGLFADPIFLSFPGKVVPLLDLSDQATLALLNDRIRKSSQSKKLKNT